MRGLDWQQLSKRERGTVIRLAKLSGCDVTEVCAGCESVGELNALFLHAQRRARANAIGYQRLAKRLPSGRRHGKHVGSIKLPSRPKTDIHVKHVPTVTITAGTLLNVLTRMRGKKAAVNA